MKLKKIISANSKRWLKKYWNQLKSLLRLTIATTFFLCLTALVPVIHSDYLLNKVGSNTVFITSPKGAANQGSATGFEVIAPSGRVYTLTNAHVCELQKDGVVMVSEKRNSGRLIPRRVIEMYEHNDLCLVEGLEGYEGLSIASSAEAGDYGYIIGYPLGGLMDLTGGYLKGMGSVEITVPETLPEDCKGPRLRLRPMSSLLGLFDVCVQSYETMQTNIRTFGGNSGSPMFNGFGQVTGVIFASNRYTDWGSAVPLYHVKDFLKPY